MWPRGTVIYFIHSTLTVGRRPTVDKDMRDFTLDFNSESNSADRSFDSN